MEGMSKGVPILGVMTKKCKISKESTFVFKITLIQGMNRQIRRMCEHFGFEVTKLERTRIMNITLKGIPVGEWRELTQEEMESIFKMVEKSSKLEDASKGKKSTSKGAESGMEAKPVPAKPMSRRAGVPKVKGPKSESTTAGGARGAAKRGANPDNRKSGGRAASASSTPDWNKSNGPAKRPARPSKGKSGTPGKSRGSKH